MTHWHVTMTAIDDAGERQIPGDYPGMRFRDRTQAASAAAHSASLMHTQVSKNGHEADVTSTGPSWRVSWTDDDDREHTRTVDAVECDEPHQTKPASGGTSDA